MRLEKRIVSWCVCSILSMGMACDSCGADATDEGEEHLEFSVTLLNQDGITAVHMFALNETFPCCQVGGADFRTVDLSGISPNSSVTFSAGRNGVVFKSVTCTARNDDPDKYVIWRPTTAGASTGTLECNGW